MGNGNDANVPTENSFNLNTNRAGRSCRSEGGATLGTTAAKMVALIDRTDHSPFPENQNENNKAKGCAALPWDRRAAERVADGVQQGKRCHERQDLVAECGGSECAKDDGHEFQED